MMRSPWPGYGRVNGIYGTQGSTGYGRLEPLTGGRIYIIIPTWKLRMVLSSACISPAGLPLLP